VNPWKLPARPAPVSFSLIALVRRLCTRARCRWSALGVAAFALSIPAAAQAATTIRVAPQGVNPNGPSQQPSLSADGRYVAFSSQASNFGPPVGTGRQWNVYVFDRLTGNTALISSGQGGAPANGSSTDPSISADGQVVAFASTATNLVPGTSKGVNEIFVRVGGGPIRRLTVGFGGVEPDSDSSQPVVSANGRYVAFTSDADNLVAGDDNGVSDVFVFDLLTGTLYRVSVTSRGGQARGASYNPSISADGHLISFTSGARNLTRGLRKRIPNVFVHDLNTGRTRLVSVSNRGKEQNASIAPPFTQFSDVSGDGRYVVFDSNATNLVAGDTNGHTDVFRRDTIAGRTILVSRNSRGTEGNNDSFAPVTSQDGSVTAFESFADNLASPWAPGPNIYAVNATTSTTTTVDVTASGGARGPELETQLLQRPAVSADGRVFAFVSGASNLVGGDYNGAEDVFLRITP
jgi:Tol biopolymer transport system component